MASLANGVPGANDAVWLDDEPEVRWWDLAVVGPCRDTTAAGLALGASTETAGSEEFGVGWDNAVPDVLHNKTVDKVTTSDGTAEPDENLIRCLPKWGTEPPSRQLRVVSQHSDTNNSERAGRLVTTDMAATECRLLKWERTAAADRAGSRLV